MIIAMFFLSGVDESLEQRKTMEQIQDLLQIIYRYTFTCAFDQVQSSVVFSEMIRHLTAEEQVQFHQLINKLISNMDE